jgi:hypothetical protein
LKNRSVPEWLRHAVLINPEEQDIGQCHLRAVLAELYCS